MPSRRDSRKYSDVTEIEEAITQGEIFSTRTPMTHVARVV